jgi:CAAX protease family protein
MDQGIQETNITPETPNYPVPWSITDTWLGVALLVILSLGMLAAVMLGISKQAVQGAGILFFELIYLLPVALIFVWRRISWKNLGFGKFSFQAMALGCGLLVAGYMIILLHNAILYLLKIDTQGDQITQIFNELNSPIWLFIVGIIVAPFVEEIFFRGFLFQGFRQKYGWVAALFLSSFIFAAAHLDPVSFIPTFILGSVLAFIYHRSNSLWPGIIFHLLINAFGLVSIYVITQFPGLIPS